MVLLWYVFFGSGPLPFRAPVSREGVARFVARFAPRRIRPAEIARAAQLLRLHAGGGYPEVGPVQMPPGGLNLTS